jgi:hypothetical protein
MERAALSGLALSLAAACAGAQVLTVIPNNFTAAEGNASSSSLFQVGPASLQALYTEAFLGAAGITPGVVIDGISYRRNGGGTTGPAADTNYASYSIFMSPTFADPLSMTNTYASNVVGTQVQVYGGPLTFAAGSMPGGATPNAFGTTVTFSTPYTYTGGSLLIEVRRSMRTGDTGVLNTDLDSTAGSQAGARWLFNISSDAAATGTLSNGAQIFRLRYTQGGVPCYANCDASTTAPVLNVADFTCFLTKFGTGDSYANCDGSTAAPTLNVADFTCFLTKFAAGCP